MATATVNVSGTIIHPIYGTKSFTAGDVVPDTSPYYFPLINSGAASYTGEVPQYKQLKLFAVNSPPDGYVLQWNASAQAYVPAPNSGGGGGGSGRGIASLAIQNKHLIVTYTDATTQDVGTVVGADGTNGTNGAQGIQGIQGIQGVPGTAGTNGTNGTNGQNAGMYKIRYTTTQPLRNTVTNDTTAPVTWFSPTAPTIGGGYAISGVDYWTPTV